MFAVREGETKIGARRSGLFLHREGCAVAVTSSLVTAYRPESQSEGRSGLYLIILCTIARWNSNCGHGPGWLVHIPLRAMNRLEPVRQTSLP